MTADRRKKIEIESSFFIVSVHGCFARVRRLKIVTIRYDLFVLKSWLFFSFFYFVAVRARLSVYERAEPLA